MIDDAIQIKRKLRRTWPVFFACHGGKLFQVQSQTIPLILDGDNLIIASPTASGKTEAVIAPIVEIILSSSRTDELSVLYVVPTRALCNDLYYRLHDCLQQVDVDVALQTGDKHGFDFKDPPDILITTPESLDSLICRHADALTGIRFVILDEIHLLDNTYRGDQLRVLIQRLILITLQTPKFYALSATLQNPLEIAGRYFADPNVVKSTGSRPIKHRVFKAVDEAINAAIADGAKKILMFCNYRAEVEELCVECAKTYPSKRIVVHHGKLGKKVREEAESFMKDCPNGLCVATMTLEIGIDIGDIDAVMLYGVPWSVSALLQRVGRGSRRKDEIAAYGICKEKEDESYFEEMFDLANRGQIEATEYSFDFSVIFSCLFANPSGITEQELSSLFSHFCDSAQLSLILGNLSKREWVEFRNCKWYAAQKTMDVGEKGYIHSNISDSMDYRIIDSKTGLNLGTLSMACLEDSFRLAGKAWKVERVEGSSVFVVPTAQALPLQSSRSYRKSAWGYLLPPELRGLE
jgi:ATP-dependent Lhr-like helicase